MANEKKTKVLPISVGDEKLAKAINESLNSKYNND